MKNFIRYFIVLFLISSAPIKIYCQGIDIDSTFNSSYEIFPFEQIENISGITMEGEVFLNRDTSLVRVILEDDNGFQYMIFETYPLICPNMYFNFSTYCDETCLLEQVNPSSIIIQVIGATLNVKSFYYSTDPKENASEERYKAKRSMDANKIERMNQLIPAYNMEWVAADNDIVALYYEQKRKMFGDGYDLRGFDYYHDGVFEFLGPRNYPKVNPELVRQFDWRDRHGANDSLSDYWDGDTLGTGWLTSVKDQGSSRSCWAFAAVGATEAITNLFTTYQQDMDLSEQQVFSCSVGGAHTATVDSALIFIKNEGVVTENCCPYIDDDPGCGQIDICTIPDKVISIKNNHELEEDQDSIRIDLIKYGPRPISIPYPPYGQHAVVLSGFEFDPQDSTLVWIIKNSWGDIGQEHGFEKMKIADLTAYGIVTPVYNKDVALNDTCRDEDNDGYYFWGIGKKPEDCNCSNIEDCDDNDSLVGGYDENYNCTCIFEMDTVYHYIFADTTWNDTTYVNYVIVVDSGAVFTISTYVGFAPEAKIIVKPGSELVIDNGYLTKVCPDLWGGIEVWGNPDSCQLKENQGTVTVKNESIIEYADTAIFTGRIDNNIIAEDYSGGIISCEYSTFRDNVNDIIFLPYYNFYVGQLREYPNRSRFTKVNFLTTANLYLYRVPVAHLKMTEVFGIYISGCFFENELVQKNDPYFSRGIGIYSQDAYYFLQQYCNNPLIYPCTDLTPCEFSSLEYGIKAINQISSRTLDIYSIKFNKNIVGLSLSGINNVSVLANDITCQRMPVSDNDERFIGGIFMENCTGYHFEANYFHHPIIGNDSGITYGLGIKNSGPENNEIYRNIFTNLNNGIICMGENRGRESGLCLKCNDMSYDTNDFVVVDDYPPTGIQGIRYYQGNPNDTISETAPAGNTFTDLSGQTADYDNILNFNYYNGAEDVYYMHHRKQSDPLTYPLGSNYTHETIVLDEISTQYNKSLACPSGLGGGPLKSISNPKETINEADDHIIFLCNLLNGLVDGGNTDELNFEVMTSLPDEGLEISLQLLYDSPYLSDTVLKQAIYKEDVLPNAMIRDIMLANPQTAKKDNFLEALDERFEPMPEYMMAQIMEGKYYFGAKELLEAQIQSWQQIRSKAKYELMRQFLLDTNMVNPIDSVIAFLETENDLKSRYDLAFAYWEKHDTTNAIATINNIPSLFTLNDIESDVHQQYVDYFRILKLMENNHWSADDLDSASVQELFELVEYGGYANIKAHSRGLLVKGGFLKYVETVNLPDYTKSSAPQYNPEGTSTIKSQKKYLRLFPNPAGDYVIAHYRVELKYQSGMISIHDIKGNLIRKYLINPGEDQMVLNLKDLPNGIYIIGLYANGHLVESEKLSKGGY